MADEDRKTVLESLLGRSMAKSLKVDLSKLLLHNAMFVKEQFRDFRARLDNIIIMFSAVLM